jgi:hypothetical protein
MCLCDSSPVDLRGPDGTAIKSPSQSDRAALTVTSKVFQQEEEYRI